MPETPKPFVAAENISIQCFIGDRQVTEAAAVTGPMRITTQGLARFGPSEVELLGIPLELIDEAALLLNRLAESLVNRRPLADGATWASRLPDTFLVAGRVRAVDHGGQSVLRLCDLVGPPDAPAKMAVTAMAVSRARGKYEEGEDELAREILERALRWYPGVESFALAVNEAENVNPNNNLAYFTLASWGEDAEKNYATALRRSEALLLAELGGPLPRPTARELLTADARALVEAIQAEDASLSNPEAEPAASPGISFLLSPVVRLEEGLPTLSVAMGPRSNRRYFFEGSIRERLRSPAMHALAAEIFERWVSSPLEVLLLSRETAVDVYESGFRFEDVRPTKPLSRFHSAAENLDHVPLLARVLATLGRELFAGLTLDEVRARWGMVDWPAAVAAANAKLSALRDREAEEIRRAYQMGTPDPDGSP